MTRSLAVIGGGITGLVAAYEATRIDPKIDVTIYEAGARLGGSIRTTPFAGRLLDEAADAFLARVPHAVELCNELGLTPELVSPAQRSAFVWSYGSLRRLPGEQLLGVPTDLDALDRSGIVSGEGIARARTDLDRPGDPPDGDLSVGTLIRDRLGDEVLERLVEPLIGGINAGRADTLSLRAVAPQVAAAADRGGSLVRAASDLRSAAAGDPDAPVFHAPEGGMGRLVDRLVEETPATFRLGTSVGHIEPIDGRWQVTPGERHDRVIVATPAFHAARLVSGAPDAAELLGAIPYASVVLVALAYPRPAVDHALDGSGFLVPAPESRLITACSFASSKWAHLGRDDTVVFRVSAGRDGDERALHLDDRQLVDVVTAELDEMVGLHGSASEIRISRWVRSFPQYRPGHLARADAIDEAVRADLPGVVVTGAAFRGLGVPACIQQGRAAARCITG